MKGRVGIGYRFPLASWIDTAPAEIQCLEITAEHFFHAGEKRLRALRKRFPLFVHGLGLSLGTPGPLDRKTLDAFARVCEIADPEWVSEHVAFSRSSDLDLGHLNPIRADRRNLDLVARHTREVSERCGKPIILENVTSHLSIRGEMPEPEFLGRLCEKADCGLLLDVTNLYVNSKNHRFNPRSWLRELDPNRIVQLHVVGYTVRNDRYEDFHAEPIQEDLFELIDEVFAYAPVKGVIIERDSHFPARHDLEIELRNLRTALEKHGSHDGPHTTS